MPMKLPFGRRKSSGNILEETQSSDRSFRVFERPGPNRSMTDGAPLAKRMSEGNSVPSALEDSDNIFAGTEQPLAKTRGATYESSTSTRLSSSSTLPSSTEVPPPDDPSSPHSRIQDIPVPPPLSGALRAATRTFSLGTRFKPSTTPVPPRHATPDVLSRRRAETESTDATATPPKLPHSNLDVAVGGDDFGKMFEHLDKPASAASRNPSPQRPQQYSSSPPTQALPGSQSGRRAARPSPINTDRSTPVEPSPYSWDSRHSEEGLLHDPDASPPESTPDTVTAFRKPSPAPSQMLGATTTHRALERRRQSDLGLRRSGIYSPTSDSNPIDDEDARMVRESLLWSGSSPPRWADAASPTETPLIDKGKAASPTEAEDSIFAHRHSPGPPDHMDPSIADSGRLAVQFAESLPKSTSPGNKVMTPSQFEHYREQQELRRSNSNSSKSDDESVNEEYDEDDEIEKQRETERQRRKQEAHLSVYRQQMMKVTGQQAPTPSLRPVTSPGNSSTTNLPSRVSNPGDKSSSGKSTEDDEEVPLGILAAHGFPNRNRPPTRLANASSNPNLRASVKPYPSSANSVTGAENGSRSSLPVFARNLPRDPYFGASLVNPPNREPLAMGGGSVYGGASSPVPPGGLINIIANEERARAMRRGNHNPQAFYQMGGVPRPYTMMGQQSQPQPPQTSATEQAQIDLSHQMTQMMQMQMEWMQRMMHMQGLQGTPTMNPGMPPFPMMEGGMPPGVVPMGPPSMVGAPMAGPPSVAGGSPNMRPASMPSAAGNPPNLDGRALGMLDPNISIRRTGSPMPNLGGTPFRPNSSYAPSIAPSERSNTGLASRYRPVSVMPGEPGHRVSSPLNQPWGDENQPTSLSVNQAHAQMPKSSSLATVTVRPVSQTSHSKPGRHKPEDDDDDEAWADMVKKRDKKKSGWKLKRGTSFGDLLGAVH